MLQALRSLGSFVVLKLRIQYWQPRAMLGNGIRTLALDVLSVDTVFDVYICVEAVLESPVA